MKIDIEIFDPCEEGMEYYNSFETTREFWDNCNRGDWMMWLAANLDVDEKLLMKTCIEQAKTVEHLISPEYKRFLKSCEEHVSGEVDLSELDERFRILLKNSSNNSEKSVLYVMYGNCATAQFSALAMMESGIDARDKNELETANIAREILSEEFYRALGNHIYWPDE